MAAKQASREQETTSPREASSFWQIVAKAFATTVVGSLLTLMIALTQSWYSDRLEQRRRQSDLGMQYQERLFDLTGRINAELREVVNHIRRNDIAQARAYLNGPFASRVREWYTSSVLLRNRGAEIYGPEVGRYIYSSVDRPFGLDACNIVVRIDDPAKGTDCPRRRRAERLFLSEFQRRVEMQTDFNSFRTERHSPPSFQANLDIVDRLVRRYIDCAALAQAIPTPENPGQVQGATGPIPARCGDLDITREIVFIRYDLLVVARSNIADAILEHSFLGR